MPVALDALLAELPADAVTTDPAVIEKYRYDWAHDPAAGMPVAVVRPTAADQVQTVMRWASTNRVPVVPRGAGSGLSGGSSAVEGGVVLSMDRMRSVHIDPDCRVAVVEPGALNAEVKAAAREHGLWYPPDPSSYEICSIGGNIATNAGGLCCVKYGVTTDYVLGLDLVLADGTAITLGGKRLKDVAGLSLLKLFVGSEGTLAVVTGAVLRLVPAQQAPSTLVALFESMVAAAAAVVEITRSTRPAMLELMDAATINAVENHLSMGLDRTAGALLLAQSDAGGAAAGAEISAMERAALRCGATELFRTDDPAEGEALAAARRAAFPAIEKLGSLLLEDVGVPIPLLAQLLSGIADIAKRNQVAIPTVAHAGDGNTHPIIVYTPGDADAERRARKAFGEIMSLAISLGGTITGEHGVGRLKKAYLPAQLGPDVMALSQRVKQALDPLGILNPGAVL
ncbi:MAG TPA: FAD-linked oxidase C-terminal domain-containing protein [Candidatus Nanopelagicales bacterium]|jgi:glycolate oxidase